MLRRSSPLRLALSAAVFIALGALVAAAVGAMQPADSSSGDALLTSNRDRLAVCVDNLNAATGDLSAAVPVIEAALVEASRHEAWKGSGYDKAQPVVQAAECPGEPYLLRPNLYVTDGKPSGEWVIPVVDSPSRYRLHVYVVSEEFVAEKLKGVHDVRAVDQEALCRGSTCYAVTTSVYLTTEELVKSAFLTEALLEGLSLVPPKGNPPDDLQQRGDRGGR